MVIALRNRSRFLNERDPCINIDLDENVAQICQTDMQHKVLTISWLNMENLMQSTLARINRMSKVGVTPCDRHSLLLHEVKIKRKFFYQHEDGLVLNVLFIWSRCKI